MQQQFPPQNQAPARILGRREVERLTGISRTHIYRLTEKGRFPISVRLSDRRVGWVESEIHAWIQDRISARDMRP